MRALRIAGTLWIFGIFLVLGVLWNSRQAAPQATARVFITNQGDGRHIYRQWLPINTANSSRQLTENIPSVPMEGFRSLAWSPDGKWIAFVDYSVHIILSHGGESIRLTDTMDGAIEWAPDGDSFIFQSYRDNNWDIYRLILPDDLVKGAPTVQRLTEHPADDGMPTWSPDGEWIAFASIRSDNWDIYRMRSTGDDVQLLAGTAQWELSPRYTPDGNWIEYEIVRDRFARVRADGSRWQLMPDDSFESIPRSRSPIINLPINWGAIMLFCMVALSIQWGWLMKGKLDV